MVRESAWPRTPWQRRSIVDPAPLQVRLDSAARIAAEVGTHLNQILQQLRSADGRRERAVCVCVLDALNQSTPCSVVLQQMGWRPFANPVCFEDEFCRRELPADHPHDGMYPILYYASMI